MRHEALLLAGAGAVALLLLRRDQSPSARIATAAERERKLWQGRLETSDFGRERIRLYWEEGVGIPNQGPHEAWSAAFVSWLTNHAVPGSLVPYGAHVYYVSAALQGRGLYRYHDPKVTPLERGDLVVKSRGESPVTLADLRSGTFLPSHGDVVVSVKKGAARAIGGNKQDTVGESIYRLRPDGTVDPSEGVFAILRIPQDARSKA